MSIKVVTLKSGQKRYRVEWRTPDRRKHRKSFKSRREAVLFEAEVEVARSRGQFLKPRAGRAITVAQAYAQWYDSRQDAKPKTRSCWRDAWRSVEPAFGNWPVGSVDALSIQRWINGMDCRPRTKRYRHTVLKQTLDYCVDQGWIAANPATRTTFPPLDTREGEVLTIDEVYRLTDLCKPSEGSSAVDQSDVVPVLALTGLRIGELVALNVADVDVDGRRIHVRAGKTRAARRVVGIPEAVVPIVRDRIRSRPAAEPAFTSPLGGRLNRERWCRAVKWAEATKKLGRPELRVHDLRRTYTSLARRAGADLKLLQASLGHESITTTAHIYGHLYSDELTQITSALDKQIEQISGQSGLSGPLLAHSRATVREQSESETRQHVR